MIGGRIALGVIWAVFLAGCGSVHYIPVKRADAIGSCQIQVPEREVLVGVAMSGGGTRAALFGAAGLEALASVQMADGASMIDKISHLSCPGGASPLPTTPSRSRAGT